ncbi:hypothetical protein [Thermospira aquatica]|uniref:Lipoprotein n=1 Tax=Thermospira aquatica TaxID=2828656 RepID=A0AAX3BEN0_9SPIR|nr:hypothetical protein [Thermospira aquatica]URA10585.1 hypothetical protein KDW03_01930 [Thermospira aquatica]
MKRMLMIMGVILYAFGLTACEAKKKVPEEKVVTEEKKLTKEEEENIKIAITKINKDIIQALKKKKSLFSFTNHLGDTVVYFDGTTEMYFPITNIDKLRELDKKFDYEYFIRALQEQELLVFEDWVNGYGVYYRYDKKRGKWVIDEFSFVGEEGMEE